MNGSEQCTNGHNRIRKAPVTIDSRVPKDEVWIISGFGEDLLVNKITNLRTSEDQPDK